MELLKLYNKAISLISNVNKFRPQTDGNGDTALCVVISENDKVYAGITGIRIRNGEVMKACPEYNAFLSMIADGCVTAKQMMTVSFNDGSVCRPCSECIGMLYKFDENNAGCEIAVSSENYVMASELVSVETAGESEPAEPVVESVTDVQETYALPIEEVPEFSEEPISDSFTFEEKFGFDFDDTPTEPVQTLSGSNTETIPAQPEQPVNPVPEQYQNMPQGMNPQFMQPNMQNYSQSQGYPYQPQGYPQGYNGMNPQFVQPNMQNYSQSQAYPYQPQGYPQGYPQPNGANPQFVQPDMQQQGYVQQYPYGQQPNQPVNANQGNFPSNAQPYPQNPVNSQPLQNVYPHQPAPYISSHYMNTSSMNSSQPVGSVPLSSGGKSKFKQRLNKFMGEDAPSAPVQPTKPVEESLSKDEIKKIARDKKKMAKVNADFKKRMKDLGY